VNKDDWPAAFVVACLLAAAVAVCAFVARGEHEDRANRQQVRLATIFECAHAAVPADCAAGVKAAIRAAS
jgi:hypothetical protein